MPTAEPQETRPGNAAYPSEETKGSRWCWFSCVIFLGRFEKTFQQRVRKHLYLRLALAGLFVSIVVCLANLPQVCVVLFRVTVTTWLVPHINYLLTTPVRACMGAAATQHSLQNV
jgi:hypothetical protein